jgi:hypothetical protein
MHFSSPAAFLIARLQPQHLYPLCAQCALVQLPKDPYIIVLHSSFLIDVQGSYQSGYTVLQVCGFLPLIYSSRLLQGHCGQSPTSAFVPLHLLQQAKKQDPSFLMRYAIFTREQQHTQKSASANAGGRAKAAIDLVSYVEFQRNYKWVLSCISSCLHAGLC